MNEKELVCILCPQGCRLQVKSSNKGILVSGNSCKRGISYAETELTAPRRVVTSTVKLEGGRYSRLPVKTSPDIPKELISACMAEIKTVTAISPVKAGQVLIRNILDTGADLVATRDM